jgi:hypothetical protein
LTRRAGCGNPACPDLWEPQWSDPWGDPTTRNPEAPLFLPKAIVPRMALTFLVWLIERLCARKSNISRVPPN